MAVLSRNLGSQRRVAKLLGANPAQVTHWRRGQRIDDMNVRRVDLLELVMASLLRLYPIEVAEPDCSAPTRVWPTGVRST